MESLQRMTNEELLNEYKAQKQLIEDIGVFGVRDILYLREIEREMDKRGE